MPSPARSCPVAFLLRRGAYRRYRPLLVLASRLVMGACLAIPYELPPVREQATWLTFPAQFLVYSSTVPLFFVALGAPASQPLLLAWPGLA